MKKSHNIALMRYNTKNISSKYDWLGPASLFITLEVGYVFSFSPDDWDMGQTFMVCCMMIMAGISYVFLFLKMRRLLAQNPISQMFFQSIFFNYGTIFNLFLGLPFILNAYWHNLVLLSYYSYTLLVVLILALLYVIQLDCKQLIDNSLQHKKATETISFSPDCVFYPFNKLGTLVWIPLIIGVGYAYYAYALRSGEKADFYITIGMLIFSAFMMYSEFCYFLLWIKYRLSKLIQ